ncbi:hypothetical protein OSTOST_12752 [Ostertagia ostertagi]
MIVPFVERLSTVGLKETDISMTNIYGYIALFDSLKMFATAGRRVLNRTGQFSALSDGKLMWDTMRRITIPGMVSTSGVGSGTVMLDDLAERVPFYSAFFVDKDRDQNVTEVLTSFWPSIDGNLPIDEPTCGFRGEKCDYTLIIVAASAVICFLLTIVGAWALRRYCETKALDRMSWRIFRDDMQIVDEEQVKSMLSLGSQRTKLSNTNISALQHHAIIGVNTHATYHMYEQRRPIKFNRSDLTLS